MRAITVRQPWAWAIFHGKDVENRSRNIAGAYRGPVAIHAALGGSRVEQSLDWDDYINDGHPLVGMPLDEVRAMRGVFIGVVDLVGVHEDTGSDSYTSGPCDCASPWAEAGTFHLMLANPRPLAEPIPCRGRLGLWTPPADALERLEAVTS